MYVAANLRTSLDPIVSLLESDIPLKDPDPEKGLFTTLYNFLALLETHPNGLKPNSKTTGVFKAVSLYLDVGDTPDNLNYVVASLIWIANLGQNQTTDGLTLARSNVSRLEVSSKTHKSLGLVSVELYRRFGGPVMDAQLAANGDIFVDPNSFK